MVCRFLHGFTGDKRQREVIGCLLVLLLTARAVAAEVAVRGPQTLPAPSMTGPAGHLSILAVPPDPQARNTVADPWLIYLDGEFDAAAAARLAALIAQQRIAQAYVLLNSPGGSLIAGMALGRVLRESRFSTQIGTRTADARRPAPGVCYSACPFAFAGGTLRSLPAGSLIGVHRATNRVPSPDEFAFQQLVAAQATAYLTEMGVSPELFAIMASVPRDAIRLLSVEEALRLRLVNDTDVQRATSATSSASPRTSTAGAGSGAGQVTP